MGEKHQKQAIIIIAHKSLVPVALLAATLNEFFEVYIHLDPRSSAAKDPLAKELSKLRGTFMHSRYCANWGSIGLLKVHLHMISKVLENPEIRFIHIISADDYPVVNPRAIYERFQASNQEWLKHESIPVSFWPPDGGQERLDYYHLYDLLDIRKNGRLNGISIRTQKLMRFRRKRSYQKRFYGGSDWYSITSHAGKILCEVNQLSLALMRDLRYTFCAAEIYPHTILKNSRLRDNVINDNQRYANFGNGKYASPLLIKKDDLPNLVQGNYSFARKFDPVCSCLIKAELATGWGLATAWGQLPKAILEIIDLELRGF